MIHQHVSAWATQFVRPGAKWKCEAPYFLKMEGNAV